MSRALLLSLAGCGPSLLDAPSDRPGAAREGAQVTLSFGADWSEAASGPLVAGDRVWVDYDPARLPRCRGVKYGRPAWGLTGFWRVNGGEVGSFPVVMHSAPPEPVFEVPEAGELELWFSNTDVYGCVDWDSDWGANYRFPVASGGVAPGWLGAADVVLSRATCDGGPCDADRRPLEQGFVFDTWARQRAAVAETSFRVWAPGVTDFDNPDLWRQLDARVHWRAGSDAAWSWDWVAFDGRVGNDARYAVPLRSIDPLPGATIVDPADCPAGLSVTPDGQYVELAVELFFSVNGQELRAPDGAPFVGTFQDYRGLYEPCF